MSMARMVLLLACLAVSACNGAKKPEDAGNASGKVLAGSISDAMINLDQKRTEPPLAGPGSGIAAGDNEAARDLLAPTVRKAAQDPAAAPSDAPVAPQDLPTKAVPITAPKPADKVAEPAVAPAKPAAKPVAKPAATTPAKPRPKPAFSKPTDDGGA